MKILKRAEKGFLPTVEIGYFGIQPQVEIEITLDRIPTDAEFDALRLALKRWAAKCGYGELMECGDE